MNSDSNTKLPESDPVEFFATIHFRNYKPGEIERINEELNAPKPNFKLFLDRYNPSRDPQIALQNSIIAALQHNRLYRDNTPASERLRIRTFWGEQLEAFRSEYNSDISVEKHEKNICAIKYVMNKEFGSTWFTEEGLKISHAQKSLNLYLKHLWALHMVKMPPHCPVDRQILLAAGVPAARAGWVHINRIDEYRDHIKILSANAGKEALSLWELRNFGARN